MYIDPPMGMMTEADPLKVSGWTVAGTSCAPLLRTANEADPTTSGLVPKKLSINTRTADPDTVGRAIMRTVWLFSSVGERPWMEKPHAATHWACFAAASRARPPPTPRASARIRTNETRAPRNHFTIMIASRRKGAPIRSISARRIPPFPS